MTYHTPTTDHDSTLDTSLIELSDELVVRVAEMVRPRLADIRRDSGDDDGELCDALGAYALVCAMSDALGRHLDIREAIGRHYIRHGAAADLTAYGVRILEELAA